jgi:hypothetical protein
MKFIAHLDDDGVVQFLDSDKNPLPPEIERKAKAQKKDVLLEWLRGEASEINSALELVLSIHLDTPDPGQRPTFNEVPFTEEKPREPNLPTIGFFTRVFRPAKRQDLEARIEVKKRAYATSVAAWEKLGKLHKRRDQQRIEKLEEGLRTDVAVMSDILQERLDSIEWPRETLVSFQIEDDGKTVWLDVDLPEIEDLPTEQASVPSRGLRLTKKQLTDRKKRENYAAHIHAITFRLAGEIFAMLPASEEVVISGYSQRPDKSTGHIQDDYLLSVRISREDWGQINFDRLVDINVIDAIARFDIRRKMTKTGIFTAIKPFSPDD